MIEGNINTFMALLGFLTVVIALGVFVWRQVKQGVKEYDKGTIESLQNAVKALEVERDVYKGQLEINKQEILKLQNQVELLTKMVTAKDEIVRLETMMASFMPLVAKDGLLNQFSNDHATMLTKLNEIKTMLTK